MQNQKPLQLLSAVCNGNAWKHSFVEKILASIDLQLRIALLKHNEKVRKSMIRVPQTQYTIRFIRLIQIDDLIIADHTRKSPKQSNIVFQSLAGALLFACLGNLESVRVKIIPQLLAIGLCGQSA